MTDTAATRWHPVMIPVLVFAITFACRTTRPDERSLQIMILQRTAQSADSDGNHPVQRLLTRAWLKLADMNVIDCGLCSLATVETGGRPYRFLGVLGRWYRIR